MLKWRKRREMEPLRGRNHEVTASKWGGNNGKKVMGCCCCLVTKSSLTLGNPMDCIACQTPLPMGFPRQEYWSRSPFPSPGDLPDPGRELRSPALQADSLLSEPPGKPQEPVDSFRNSSYPQAVCPGKEKWVIKLTSPSHLLFRLLLFSRYVVSDSFVTPCTM